MRFPFSVLERFRKKVVRNVSCIAGCILYHEMRCYLCPSCYCVVLNYHHSFT